MAVRAAHPVRTLRDLVATLEAAITLVRTNAKSKPVHDLRTTTRRIEAQLELLALLPDLPEHRKPAKKARKLLRKLRRAAGRVRDLDVQRGLIRSKSDEAHKLRSLFKQQRGQAVERLLDIVHKHQSKLDRHLKALLEMLTSAQSLAIPAEHLIQLTLDWYAHQTSAPIHRNHRQLHDIRKAAKLARYIIESAGSASTRHLALTFESLQKSGGDWHDWHTLSRIARRELSSSSSLTQSFTHRREKSLAEYQSQLKALPRNLAPSNPRNIA
ncbi:CHAD domain-containing protein [Edaphobacter paludis]|uniref:CHAD domain-containing protein n=1 Tax=Edaphobacter paludis TaxID=3035702 RepID=A0AAU7CZD4_9BACT